MKKPGCTTTAPGLYDPYLKRFLDTDPAGQGFTNK